MTDVTQSNSDLVDSVHWSVYINQIVMLTNKINLSTPVHLRYLSGRSMACYMLDQLTLLKYGAIIGESHSAMHSIC
jgi:hypothetical protein